MFSVRVYVMFDFYKIKEKINSIFHNPSHKTINAIVFSVFIFVLFPVSYVIAMHVSNFLNFKNENIDNYTIVKKLNNSQNALLSPRVIDALSISDVVPKKGKILVADLKSMAISLYLDGKQIAKYKIISKGREGTPWDTPSGLYKIHTKERNHLSSIAKVYMPYSMQFYGNYFIHGETYYPDGTPTTSTFSGGCIRLYTKDMAKVFNFADIGTKVFIFDPKEKENLATLYLNTNKKPEITATSFLVADLDTRDVYSERMSQKKFPISSITKLMTAIVANETINFKKRISLFDESLLGDSSQKSRNHVFTVEELMYPLLMGSDNNVAKTLSAYIGKQNFVTWMNNSAKAFNMNKTKFYNAVGDSMENVSTVDDLFRLAWYLKNKKSFPINITKKDIKTIKSLDGHSYKITNVNTPVDEDPFAGGKAGFGKKDNDSMLSFLSLNIDGTERMILLVVLGSKDRVTDINKLALWTSSVLKGSKNNNTACVSCITPHYRKIELP